MTRFIPIAALALALAPAPALAKPLGFELLTADTPVPTKGVWHVERTIQIAAAPAFIQPYVGDLNHFTEWAAWNKEMDPKSTWAVEGSPQSVGQTITWDGPKMGRGHLTLTSATGGTTFDLYFGKDPAPNRGRITVSAADGGSVVVWETVGALSFPGTLFRRSIEKSVTGDFDKGLAGLKALAEADAKKASEEAAARRVAEEAAAKQAAEEAAAKKLADEAVAAKAAEEAATALAAEEAAKKGKKRKK